MRADAPSLLLEKALASKGYQLIAGVDEVGRGSWAGPIVAAAVILPLDRPGLEQDLEGVRDSKQLTAQRREELLPLIAREAHAIGVGWCTRRQIDLGGIGAANRAAMTRAVSRLHCVPDALLIDHVRLQTLALPQWSYPRADRLSLSVAAASIVAKVVRDRWMVTCERRYPGYGFAAHKGYGTPSHREALELLGPSPIHRMSFRPLLLTLL